MPAFLFFLWPILELIFRYRVNTAINLVAQFFIMGIFALCFPCIQGWPLGQIAYRQSVLFLQC